MFFSKIFSFGPKKEDLLYETPTYKMFSTFLDDKKVTKFVYKKGVKQYSLLKNIHHDNLISPIKISVKNNIFYTQPLFPFIKIYKSSTCKFNEHIFLCLAKSLVFIHEKCQISHNNIETDSLFFTEDGKIVLGGFEKSSTNIDSSFSSDNIQFSNLMQKYLKINTNLLDFIKNNKSSKYFINNEIFLFGFSDQTLENKKDFLEDFKNKKKDFIDLYKLKIIKIFIQDLNKEFENSYKYEIINTIFYIDLENYENILVLLFNVLDTNVRIYLFKNSKLFIDKVENLDKSFDSLLLGLKIRKNNLRKETINFFKNNETKFCEINKIKILETMYEFITEPEDILLVLKYVKTSNINENVDCKTDIIYRMCKNYLKIPSVRNETLNVIQIYYKSFNKNKVSTELLPLICTYLADEKLQTSTFLIIENILTDLKCHKEKIISKDWSFTELFSNKKNIKSKSVEDIKLEIEKEKKAEDSGDEWDDDW
ncbi:N-terminal kinase-like protein [Vairimorpha necatrix]|uniref:N-terminal kinase-like protein n=1 Tax=Vairimorpha necatrix TaxID=6039 RepID=A0AAX4JAA5_9MICR